MIECPYTIGDRQTVDRAKHPTLGEGRLVHRNGPAFFIADSGEWCDLTDVGWGGSESTPRRSWKTARQGGKRIEIDELDDGGESHCRVYVHTRGRGWLTWNIGRDCHQHRVHLDGSEPFDFRPDTIWSGLPEHRGCRTKDATAQTAARAAGWMCMSDRVTTLVWCHEVDVEKALAYLERRDDPKPEKPKRGKKAAPSGPLPDIADMTREQIQAWERGGA